MFVDASAIVAILTRELVSAPLVNAIKGSDEPITSAIAVYETVMAIARKKGASISNAEAEVCAFLTEARIGTVTLGAVEAEAALSAASRYGKGRGHPAQLNMGDCFAYACARAHAVPLLYVGDDFARTDIPSALSA